MSKIYEESASALKLVKSKRMGLKEACYRTKGNVRAVTALVSKVLRLRKKLEAEVALKWPGCKNLELAVVMLFDYWKTGKISGGGLFKQNILKRFKKKQVEESIEEYRWVRTNPSKGNVHLEGQDRLIKGLFRVKRSKEVEDLINQGKVIAQEKASCMPAEALVLEKGNWNAIDACAAPGNKTLQLAARMKPLTSGKLFAYEISPKRYQLLKSRVETLGSDNIVVKNEDFLRAQLPERVSTVLLDPSCSGSGILSQQLVDYSRFRYNPNYKSKRVKSIAGFQQKILLRALEIPCVKQVIYSTCSVYKAENEEVVESVMLKKWRKFKLVKVLPQWKRRGLGKWGDYMLRTNPFKDNTQGFFVAYFKKRPLRLKHRLITRTHGYWNRKKHIKFN